MPEMQIIKMERCRCCEEDPHNVLRHFPITPRLQRLFHDVETREDVMWYSRNQEYRDQNVMSHPSHGSEWKSSNDKHKEFAADPRNIRLGLASNGFNPWPPERHI